MWEEHPEYQKAQARAIGLLILVWLIGAVVYAGIEGDWDLLEGALLFAAGLVAALGVLAATGWILVKIFTHDRSDDSQLEKDRDP